MSQFIRNAANFLKKKRISWLHVFGAIGGVVLVGMMMVTVADAIGRKFGHPVYGSYEVVSFLLALLFFVTIVYTGIKKRHFVIDIVTTRFPSRVRLSLIIVMYLVSALLSWLLGWRLVIYGFGQKASNATGMEFTFLPTYPFIWVAALCSVVLGWVFLVQAISFLGKATEKE